MGDGGGGGSHAHTHTHSQLCMGTHNFAAGAFTHTHTEAYNFSGVIRKDSCLGQRYRKVSGFIVDTAVKLVQRKGVK